MLKSASTSVLLFLGYLSFSAALSTLDSRRSFLKAAAAAFVATATPPPFIIANASPYCSAGVGDNCQDLSEGNAYIKALQEKSAENKEANLKASTLAYQLKNYPDFFASLTPPKYMVMKKDGTFVIFTEEELTPLKQAGKIKIENPMAFGGTIMDVTQKPVMVLVE